MHLTFNQTVLQTRIHLTRTTHLLLQRNVIRRFSRINLWMYLFKNNNFFGGKNLNLFTLFE